MDTMDQKNVQPFFSTQRGVQVWGAGVPTGGGLGCPIWTSGCFTTAIRAPEAELVC